MENYDSAVKREMGMSTGMQMTNTRLLRTNPHTPDIAPVPDPWVRGRSGEREGRGMLTSGLSGEAFNRDPDPQKNTASQRSWLYSKDPSLTSKPRAAVSMDPHPTCIPGPKIVDYDPDKMHYRNRALTKPRNGRFMDADD